jgi:acetyl-CoA carboxylase biotin carboxyl carrier protein
MDIGKIKQIVELLVGTDITELHVEKDGECVTIKRGKPFSSIVEENTHRVSYKEKEESEEKGESEESDTQKFFTVTSPIVGTLYRASSPDASAFVEEGNTVKKGQILCIIEAMKLMNEIESEIDGVIVKILVENGQPVEYGQKLFLIEPTQ